MFSVISRTDARRDTQSFLPRAVGAEQVMRLALADSPMRRKAQSSTWTRCLRWHGERSSSQSRARPNDALSGASGASRCLDIVTQCRGLLLHFVQAVLDDVADRDDADHLILLDDRNVAELACRHPLHDRADGLRLAACDDLARHHLSKRLRE